MKLELRQKDGSKQTFQSPFISARMLRRTIEVSREVNFNDMTVDELDRTVGYVVELFGKQFTIDDVYDGLPAGKLISTILDCINAVVGGVSEATSEEGK